MPQDIGIILNFLSFTTDVKHFGDLILVSPLLTPDEITKPGNAAYNQPCPRDGLKWFPLQCLKKVAG
jgi:hypothetical protein